jgi:hypothetical protein
MLQLKTVNRSKYINYLMLRRTLPELQTEWRKDPAAAVVADDNAEYA